MAAVIRFPCEAVRPAAEPYAGLREKVAEMFRSEAAAQAAQASPAAVERTQDACRRIASLALAASSLQTGSTPGDERVVAEVVADLLETIEEMALHGARWLEEAPAGSGRI